MSTLKMIDGKSLIIGALLVLMVSTLLGATSKDDKGKWDGEQMWSIANGKIISDEFGNVRVEKRPGVEWFGYEPFAVVDGKVYFRARMH